MKEAKILIQPDVEKQILGGSVRKNNCVFCVNFSIPILLAYLWLLS